MVARSLPQQSVGLEIFAVPSAPANIICPHVVYECLRQASTVYCLVSFVKFGDTANYGVLPSKAFEKSKIAMSVLVPESRLLAQSSIAKGKL